MELDKRNIEEYINRFLEGETTNAEEQAIYRFFHTGDVPDVSKRQPFGSQPSPVYTGIFRFLYPGHRYAPPLKLGFL